MIFQKFATLIFDCDGVILNSNKVKSDAFYNVTSCFSESAANDLVSYHKANGGISRYKKFKIFKEKIIPNYLPKNNLNVSDLLENYSKEVIRKLINCDIALGLKEFKKLYQHKKWMMVSGSDEKELNFILKKKGISNYFEGGIYGSPDSKDKIFNREIEKKNIEFPAIYIGDSKYDFIASKKHNIDFIFMYDWTEFENWQAFIKKNKVSYFKNFIDINKNVFL